MKKFSVITLQTLVVLLCIVLPVILLFSSYSGNILHVALSESERGAQNTLSYVRNTFEILTDFAQSEAIRISASKDYITEASLVFSYDQVIQNVDLRESIDDVVHRLATVQFTDNRLRNIYLYTLNTDYILTSDRGILQLNSLNDRCWLADYLNSSEAGSYRMALWNARIVPETDLLCNGSRDGETPVISYILPVRIANSRQISLLVMNYYETKLAALINADEQGNVYLIDGNGSVICHPDLEQIGHNYASEPHIQAALQSTAPVGSYCVPKTCSLLNLFHIQNAMLYSYQRTAVGNWIIFNENKMLSFQDAMVQLTRRYLVMLLVCLFVCGFLCFSGMKLVLHPIEKLFREIGSESGNIRNEILAIEDKIQQMRLREQELLDNALSTKNDLQKLYLFSLWRGMPWLKEVPIPWNDTGFVAVVFALDVRNQISGAVCGQLPLLLKDGVNILSSFGQTEGFCPDTQSICFVISISMEKLKMNQAKIVACLQQYMAATFQTLQATFTAGIGSWAEDEDNVYSSCRNAVLACRQRILVGRGHVIQYTPDLSVPKPYSYPKNVEAQILHAVMSSDQQSFTTALNHLRETLMLQNVENIPPILRQMMDSISAWLVENGYADSLYEDDYTPCLQLQYYGDTLDELLEQLHARMRKIMDYLNASKPESNYIKNILNYIDAHYTEDIDFEQMSDAIGISYSYARRIVKMSTEQSLLDIIHQRRIAQAKRLLKVEPELNMRDIAQHIGYHNIQSFNRFFKKFEGVTPSQYREIQN